MMHDQTNQGGRQNYHRVAAEVLDEERTGPLISLALIVFPTKRSYLPIPKVPGVRTRMTRSRCRATALALSCLPCTLAFTAVGVSRLQTNAFSSSRAALPAGIDGLPSSILTAVETFDGSSIVDPVVVSGAFWTSLKAKLLSVIIGQILATIVFVGLSSVVASQLPKVGEAIGNAFFRDDNKAKLSSTVSQFASTSADAVKRSTSNAQPDFGKLLICLLIDAIGTSSELIPFVGEATDVVWAPIAALGLRSLYGSNVVFGLELVEEILPFTDIIPLATICWYIESFAPDGDLAKALGIGSFGTNMNTGTIIDTSGVDELQQNGGRSLKDADPRK